MQSTYSDDSIRESKGPDSLRNKPSTLLGSATAKGANHVVFEIVANGLDEARQGFGSLLEIKVEQDYTVSVRDYGRGVPMAWNSKEGKFNWELVFCTLYASGKDHGDAYSSSEGLNGVGCTASQYTSDFMHVESWRRTDDGSEIKHYIMDFKDGYPDGDLRTEDYDGETTGTLIRFRPSLKVFTGNRIVFEQFADKLRRKTMLIKGLTTKIDFYGTEPIQFCFPKGMCDFLEISCENPINREPIEIIDTRDNCNDSVGAYDPEKDYTASIELYLGFGRENNFIEMYHNGAILSLGGPTKEAVIEGVIKVMNRECLDRGKLSKGEKINKKDVEDLISAVGESRCPGKFSMFEHQTKAALENPSIYTFILETVQSKLAVWCSMHKKETDSIVAQIVLNKEMREKMDSVKKSFLKKLTGNINKYGSAPDKYLGCETTNPAEAELYFVEGDSAKGPIVEARDAKFQAVLPLRGKITNCLKKPLEAILNTKGVIIGMIQVLGCGIELKSKYIKDIPEFNIDKLNFSKIFICTDADIDGGHITCLILIFLYRLMPTVLKRGKVYLALSPLYLIQCKALNKKYYAYNDAEKDKIIRVLADNGYSGTKVDIRRFKGLGESNADILGETVMNPNTRRVIQVTYPEDEEELRSLCEALLGDDLETRKSMIQAYFNQVNEIVG